MTVSQLIEILKRRNPDDTVVVANFSGTPPMGEPKIWDSCNTVYIYQTKGN